MSFNNPIRWLQQLMTKYLSGKATPVETAFLEKWYDHFDTAPAEGNTAEDMIREKELLEALNQRIDHREKARIFPLYKSPVTKAAAIILLILTGGLCWYKFTHHQKLQTIAAHPPVMNDSDKAPGTDKAILTLANGRQIILGDKTNDNIPRQGGASILQVDSGSIAYHPAENANAPALYNTITTPGGGQYHIVLADGTKVWLNSTSSLKFPTQFNGAARLVELEGEGYFEVAKDAAHPFRVKTDQMQVEVLGTSFNIMAYNNEGQNRTTLVDGAVKLVNGKSSSLLKPGQQGSVNKEAGDFSVVTADLDEVLAWKEGKFRFVNADITMIMRQIARWYDVAVVYQGPLPQKRLSGAFSKKQNVSNLFEALEEVSDVHFSMSGNTITVTASSNNK